MQNISCSIQHRTVDDTAYTELMKLFKTKARFNDYNIHEICVIDTKIFISTIC